jgi:hypothetical protein
MRTPIVLFVLCSAAFGSALLLLGLSDIVLVAGPAWLASLLILARAWRAGRAGAAPVVIVDGSNVMYWDGGTPTLAAVGEVVALLTRSGYRPGVVFDANAGHLLEGRYRHDGAFARKLGLPRDRVMVVDRGTPADTVILAAARDLDARVVSNDRYRDWAQRHPEIGRPGFLIRGGFSEGRIWLDLAPEDDARTEGARQAA